MADPYQSLANPTKQARRLMSQRGIGDGDDGGPYEDDSDRSPDNESFGQPRHVYADEQAKRVLSLENELADTKKLLMEVTFDRQTLEKEKADLQRLVEELSGGGDGSGGAAGAGGITVQDRAKSTILSLRLKRIEQKRGQFIDYVKTQSRTASTNVKKARTAVTDLRAEIEGQFGRVQEFLSESITDFESMADALQRAQSYGSDSIGSRMAAVVGGGGMDGGGELSSSDAGAAGASGSVDSRGAYLGMVAAAVQQQQRNIVLSADHPLIQRLTVLYNGLDVMVNGLNTVWRDLPVFSEGGVAPFIPRPRRYIDSLSNVNNYIVQVERVQRCVAHVNYVHRLSTDLQLPLLARNATSIIAQADAALKARVEEFFDAMRAVRTSVVVKQRNLATAMRIFAACDAVSHDAFKIFTQYLRLGKSHTMRMLQHMSRVLRYAQQNRYVGLDVGDPGEHMKSVGQCGDCGTPVFCEDCYRISAVRSDALRVSSTRHRREVRDFTLVRLEHFKKLMGLIDDSIHILSAARLVPLDKEAGQAAADKALDEVVRKPQPPTSVNYFTRMRKHDINRERVSKGQNPDTSTDGLPVKPLSVDQQRSQLLKMLASTDLRHVPEQLMPAEELEAERFSRRLAALGDDGEAGVPGSSALVHRAVTASTAQGSRGPSMLGTMMSTTALGGGATPQPPPRLDALTRQRTAERLSSHLPELAGPRAADATLTHVQRLDAMRRHHASVARGGGDAAGSPRKPNTARMTRQEGAPLGDAGGGGPGSAWTSRDRRHGFDVSRSPRTITERMLGPSGGSV